MKRDYYSASPGSVNVVGGVGDEVADEEVELPILEPLDEEVGQSRD